MLYRERGISLNGKRFQMVDPEDVDADYVASGLGLAEL